MKPKLAPISKRRFKIRASKDFLEDIEDLQKMKLRKYHNKIDIPVQRIPKPKNSWTKLDSQTSIRTAQRKPSNRYVAIPELIMAKEYSQQINPDEDHS